MIYFEDLVVTDEGRLKIKESCEDKVSLRELTDLEICLIRDTLDYNEALARMLDSKKWK